MKKVNSEIKISKAKLKNLWTQIGYSTGVGAFSAFIDDPRKYHIWRRFVNDESGHLSHF